MRNGKVPQELARLAGRLGRRAARLGRRAAQIGRWAAVAGLVAAALLPAVPARAQVRVTTDFPGVAARPGQSVTFSIEVRNADRPDQVLALDLNGPEGWAATLRGGGKAIHRVTAVRGETAFFDVQIEVPRDAAPGDYTFDLRASGPDGTLRLPLSVHVDESAAEPSEIAAEFPILRGPAGATFEFDLDLRNQGGEERTFALAASAPQGWQVELRPEFGDEQIATLSVDAGASKGFKARVTAPQRIEAGTYPIRVQADAGGTPAQLELKVEVTGTHSIELTTPSGRLNAEATAGRRSPIRLTLENTGTAPLTGIALEGSLPNGWSVTFDPDQVESIPPGESRAVTAFLTPDARAIAGDYAITLTARAQEATDDADIRVAVQAPTLWGWVGLGIVVLTVAGVAWVFRSYGRR